MSTRQRRNHFRTNPKVWSSQSRPRLEGSGRNSTIIERDTHSLRDGPDVETCVQEKMTKTSPHPHWRDSLGHATSKIPGKNLFIPKLSTSTFHNGKRCWLISVGWTADTSYHNYHFHIPQNRMNISAMQKVQIHPQWAREGLELSPGQNGR